MKVVAWLIGLSGFFAFLTGLGLAAGNTGTFLHALSLPLIVGGMIVAFLAWISSGL